MAESEQIWWAYVKIENVAEIYSARIDSSWKFVNFWAHLFFFFIGLYFVLKH